MDKTQVELELQIAHQWAKQGNLERTILHIELAQKYLLEDDRNTKGRVTLSKSERILKLASPTGKV